MNKHAQPVYKQGGWDVGVNQYQNDEQADNYAQFTNGAYDVNMGGESGNLHDNGALGDSKEYNLREQDFEDQNFQVTHSKTENYQTNDNARPHEQDDTKIRTQRKDNRQQAHNPSKNNKRPNPIVGQDDDTPMPLIKTGTCLMPDMKFGWKPEVKCSHPPIPLYFDFVSHRLNIYSFRDDPLTSDVIVYQEKRSHDSYQMHKRFANLQLQNGCWSYKFNFPKNHDGGRFNYDGLLEQIFGAREPPKEADDPDDFVGMNPECERLNRLEHPDKEFRFLKFDSDFESGNLDMVIKSHKTNSYDVFLRPDTNTTGYFQWFYFRVRNRCRGTTVRINVVNMTKRNSLYQQGMPVQVLSLRKSQNQGATWGFGGKNVKYRISKLMSNQRQPPGDENNSRQRIYFQLGWDYTFEYDDDEVYFAYSLPYTFSMVTNFVQQIQTAQDQLIHEYQRKKQEDDFQDPKINETSFKVVETSYITTSLGGIEVPMLTITDFSHTKDEELRKKVVVITGRVHPGESNASWVVHGLIRFLLKKDKVSEALRKRIIFKVIPMINADGVSIGNTRCSFIGRDVNRLFGNPNQKLLPEPYYLRQLVKDQLKNDKHKVLAYLDVHAHSGRKSVFMYGPYFPLHCSKYMKIRTLPKLISERTQMFRFFSCKFKIEKYKENCARIAIWRDFNITNCFTIESSSFGFLNNCRETIYFNTGLLQETGECIVQSLFEYNLIQEEDRRMKVALAKRLKAQRKARRLTIAEILGTDVGKSQIGGLPSPDKRIRSGKDEFQHGSSPTPIRVKDIDSAIEVEEGSIRNIEFDGASARVTQFNKPNPNEASGNPQNADESPQLQLEGLITDNPVLDTQQDSSLQYNRSLRQQPMSIGGQEGDDITRNVGWQQDNVIRSQNQNGSEDSVDSHAFADSSSSDDQIIDQGIQPVLKNRTPNILQPRLSSQNVYTSGKPSQVQNMLARRKGIDTQDGEEVFHRLYNPYFEQWKEKRQKYIHYDQLQKIQHKAASKYNVRTSSQYNSQGHLRQDARGITDQSNDFLNSNDQYLTKEVRTFDEVYKSIKSNIKEHQLMKNKKAHSGSKKRATDQHIQEDSDESGGEEVMLMEDEYGNEEEFDEDLLDDQDIDDQDREVLNDRILGLINVFQNIGNSNQYSQISSKQVKLLQDLGKKNLSIEKKNKVEVVSPRGLESCGGVRTEHGFAQAGNLKIQGSGIKSIGSTDNLELEPPIKKGINPLGVNLLASSSSNREIAFKSTAPRMPQTTSLSQTIKKRRQNPNVVYAPGSVNSNPAPQAVYRPTCNIYNLGGTGGNIHINFHPHHRNINQQIQNPILQYNSMRDNQMISHSSSPDKNEKQSKYRNRQEKANALEIQGLMPHYQAHPNININHQNIYTNPSQMLNLKAEELSVPTAPPLSRRKTLATQGSTIGARKFRARLSSNNIDIPTEPSKKSSNKNRVNSADKYSPTKINREKTSYKQKGGLMVMGNHLKQSGIEVGGEFVDDRSMVTQGKSGQKHRSLNNGQNQVMYLPMTSGQQQISSMSNISPEPRTENEGRVHTHIGMNFYPPSKDPLHQQLFNPQIIQQPASVQKPRTFTTTNVPSSQVCSFENLAFANDMTPPNKRDTQNYGSFSQYMKQTEKPQYVKQSDGTINFSQQMLQGRQMQQQQQQPITQAQANADSMIMFQMPNLYARSSQQGIPQSKTQIFQQSKMNQISHFRNSMYQETQPNIPDQQLRSPLKIQNQNWHPSTETKAKGKQQYQVRRKTTRQQQIMIEAPPNDSMDSPKKKPKTQKAQTAKKNNFLSNALPPKTPMAQYPEDVFHTSTFASQQRQLPVAQSDLQQLQRASQSYGQLGKVTNPAKVMHQNSNSQGGGTPSMFDQPKRPKQQSKKNAGHQVKRGTTSSQCSNGGSVTGVPRQDASKHQSRTQGLQRYQTNINNINPTGDQSTHKYKKYR